ncbi:MAG TPA: hypothetical protein VMX38_07550 [Verrucomicrobiae bacterium]|jgi:hypothetical protein|nr:hypothetical protein [Verrucomicrobiae bacterium]
MNCEEIRERMPEVAAGFDEPTAEESNHLAGCVACAEQFKAMQRTMAVLDEWKVSEPSPYFDVRLQARLREEMAKPQAGWLQWVRRPVLAAALTVLMGVGVGLFFARGNYHSNDDMASMSDTFQQPEPGTAVSDLQALDKNHDLYSDFELLDDLSVQSDVNANP